MGNLRGIYLFSVLLASVFEYSVFGEKANYINDDLPYRVQESLLDYSDEIGDRNKTGPIRLIYRKDLDPNYVAYYELQFGDHFYIFSAGPKTKDHRLVQEGQNQRPTDFLIEQATKNNNTCYKFFRLSPDGVTICEDRSGRAVATTMDLNTLTTQANLTTLTKDVWKDLKDFKEEWEKVAKEVRSSLQWKSTKIFLINQIPDNSAIVFDVLEPGESQSLPIGTTKLSDVEISLHYDQASKTNNPNQKINQEVLCLLLGNICTNSFTKVNVNKILNTKNNLYFIQFKLNDDYDLVAKKLNNKDASFYFMLKIRKKTIVLKYYTIHTAQKRVRRSVWSGYQEYSIPNEDRMPDYDQHICCGGCHSGCTPVAWAQIFAYFDRLARYSNFYSQYIWQGVNGVTGDPGYVAPKNLNSHVKKYVEELRRPLRTFCDSGSGATYSRNSINLYHWFRRRQTKGTVKRIFSKSQVVRFVKIGYPVMTNIWWVSGGSKKKSGHSVVVTKIKERSRSYKHCRRVGFWFTRRWKCEWKWQYDYLWFRRLGWGGFSNGWYPASFTSAFVAYKTL